MPVVGIWLMRAESQMMTDQVLRCKLASLLASLLCMTPQACAAVQVMAIWLDMRCMHASAMLQAFARRHMFSHIVKVSRC